MFPLACRVEGGALETKKHRSHRPRVLSTHFTLYTLITLYTLYSPSRVVHSSLSHSRVHRGGSMSKPERTAGLRSNLGQMSVKTRQMSVKTRQNTSKCPAGPSVKSHRPVKPDRPCGPSTGTQPQANPLDEQLGDEQQPECRTLIAILYPFVCRRKSQDSPRLDGHEHVTMFVGL